MLALAQEEPLTQFEFQKLLLEPEIAVILSGLCATTPIALIGMIGSPSVQEKAWMSLLWSTAST